MKLLYVLFNILVFIALGVIATGLVLAIIEVLDYFMESFPLILLLLFGGVTGGFIAYYQGKEE